MPAVAPVDFSMPAMAPMDFSMPAMVPMEFSMPAVAPMESEQRAARLARCREATRQWQQAVTYAQAWLRSAAERVEEADAQQYAAELEHQLLAELAGEASAVEAGGESLS